MEPSWRQSVVAMQEGQPLLPTTFSNKEKTVRLVSSSAANFHSRAIQSSSKSDRLWMNEIALSVEESNMGRYSSNLKLSMGK